MILWLMTIFVAVKSVNFWFMVLIGACIGSFLNVCILRIPEKTFFKNLRSVCPSCGSMIPGYLNIPIISFLVLRGRAKCCGAKISNQYLIIEILTAAIFGLVYLQFPFLGLENERPVFESLVFIRWIHAATFVSLLLVMSVIDSKLMIIPDELSIGMIVLSPFVAAIHPELDLTSSLLGVLFGGGILYAVAWAYWVLRKQYGLGFGDVKLLAAIGGWLGWQSVFPTLFLGSIVGSTIAVVFMLSARTFSWQAKIPFGPYLAIGAVAHLFFGPELFAILNGG